MFDKRVPWPCALVSLVCFAILFNVVNFAVATETAETWLSSEELDLQASTEGGAFTPRARSLKEDDYQEFVLSLERSMSAREQLPFEKIGVAFNANLDLVAHWRHVLAHFGFAAPPQAHGAFHESLGSLGEWAEAFQHSFENGVAMERIVTDKDVCHALERYIANAPDTKIIIGGNAANMMLTFQRHGVTLLPGFTPGPELKKLLAQHGIVLDKVSDSSEAESEAEDLYHIILEFKKGDVWGDLVSPRANRFIFHCDQVNSRIPDMESFHTRIQLESEGVDLAIIAGLHLLEQESAEFSKARLLALQERLLGVPPHLPLHLELASVGTLEFMRTLFLDIALHVDSLGFNEQELFTLYEAAFPDSPDLSQMRVQMKDPTVDMCVRMMQRVQYEIVRLNPNPKSRHRVGRMHLHTLKFHVVSETAFGGWRSGNASIAAGALAAAQRACNLTDTRDPALELKFDLHLLKNEALWGRPLSSFGSNVAVHQLWHHALPKRPLINYWIAPVMVCKNPVGTVGLGDAISSMGLLYHKFNLANVDQDKADAEAMAKGAPLF